MPRTAGAHFELLLAHDTALRGRLRVQARPADRLAAIAACAVAALGDAGEGHIDFGELANIARHGGYVEIAEDVRQHPILGCDELVHESGHPRVIAVGEFALYLCAQRLPPVRQAFLKLVSLAVGKWGHRRSPGVLVAVRPDTGPGRMDLACARGRRVRAGHGHRGSPRYACRASGAERALGPIDPAKSARCSWAPAPRPMGGPRGRPPLRDVLHLNM